MNVGDRYRNTYRVQAAIDGLGYIICYRSAPTQYAGPMPVVYDISYRLFLVPAHCRNARFYLIDTRFVKKFGDHLSFAGGVFGGKYVGREEIVAIASIPGLDVLRGMFAQLLNSPRQRFAVVLSKVAETRS